MNVRQQNFENTKQAILQNKLEFLQAQLIESNARKQKIRHQNKSLKRTIRQLKTQQTFKSTKRANTSSINSSFLVEKQYINTNSQSSNNLIKYGKQNLRDNIPQGDRSIETAKIQYEKHKRQLEQLQNQMGILKQIWQKRNKTMAHQGKNLHQIQPEIKESKPRQYKKQERKTMSVNLYHHIPQKQLNLGTNPPQKNQSRYTVKLSQRPSDKNSLNNSLLSMSKLEGSHKFNMSRASSSNNFCVGKNNHNLNQSLLNTSKMSNSSMNTSLVGKKKSYAKIITSLQCQGCSACFKPNLYYRHIESCRDYILLDLEKQKEQIEEKINETINLSISYI